MHKSAVGKGLEDDDGLTGPAVRLTRILCLKQLPATEALGLECTRADPVKMTVGFYINKIDNNYCCFLHSDERPECPLLFEV